MQVTDVRVRKVTSQNRMKAIASITIDDVFVIHDIKVIESDKGLFIAMPSRKTPNWEFKDKSLREKDEIKAYYRKKMEMYLSQNQILVVKKSYDRMERLDIKPQIEKYVFNIDDSVDLVLSAGPRSNISPAIVMNGYFEYINEKVDYEVKRKKILYS